MLSLLHKSVYVADKRAFKHSTLIQDLSALFMFSKFKIVIFHMHSYIFIIISNLQLLLAFMLRSRIKKRWNKNAVPIGFVNFCTAAEYGDASTFCPRKSNVTTNTRQDEVAGELNTDSKQVKETSYLIAGQPTILQKRNALIEKEIEF